MKSFNWKKVIIFVITALVSFLLVAFFIICINQLFCIIINKIPDYFININSGTIISNTIYFLTLLAIIWYSFETRLLREATLGRPLISIIKNVSDTIEIRNDGSNIAYNIKIYFLYEGKTARDKIEIAVLGKGLSYKVEISNKEIDKGNGEKVELSELINISPPDKHLKVIVDYSDSIENEGQFRDKWKLDETVIMSSANEGRFRMIYSDNKKIDYEK